MLALFEKCGFSVEESRVDKWDRLPIARQKLSRSFRDLPEDDLLVSGFDVILLPK